MSVPPLLTVWRRLSASTQQRAQVSFANVLLVLVEMADIVEKVALVRTIACYSSLDFNWGLLFRCKLYYSSPPAISNV